MCPVLSHVPLCVARQALLSTGYFRQEYWSELPFPPGNLSNPGSEPASPKSLALRVNSLPIEPSGKKINGNSTLFVGLFYKDSVRYYI